jgi:hypothetical protein
VADARTSARFPDVPDSRGHYESFYLKTGDPGRGLAVWIRYTVHKRPGEPPDGSVWFTLFDGRGGGPVASKVTLKAAELGTGPDHYLQVGESRIEPGRAAGSARSDRLDASWELAFDGDEPPLRHLPREWMYRARLPRTKLLSPHPLATFRGWVQAGDRQIEVGGWDGAVGHNWGAQHAERWIWLHGTGFAEDGDAWLDVALGRVKLGPWTTPWIGNGALSLGGERHRLGGIERARSTHVDEHPGRCDLVVPGDGLSVRAAVRADRKDTVAWVYADPDGSQHHSLNCSIADVRLAVERERQAPVELAVERGGVYELGLRDSDHGIPVQPFPDG